MKVLQSLLETAEEAIEGTSTSRFGQQLAYQSMLGALDTSHVNKRENGFQFNLGAVAKLGAYNNLDVRIVQGNVDDVKFGKLKNGEKFIILVTTPNLPKRMEIDSFFDNEEVMNKMLDAMEQYRELDTDEYEPNDAEISGDLYKPEKFEEYYDKLVDAINKKSEEYSEALEKLKSTKTVNVFKKASLDDASSKLKHDYFGSNVKEFTKIVMKLPESDFIKHLNKEMKDKLFKRLESLYGQNLNEAFINATHSNRSFLNRVDSLYKVENVRLLSKNDLDLGESRVTCDIIAFDVDPELASEMGFNVDNNDSVTFKDVKVVLEIDLGEEDTGDGYGETVIYVTNASFNGPISHIIDYTLNPDEANTLGVRCFEGLVKDVFHGDKWGFLSALGDRI